MVAFFFFKLADPLMLVAGTRTITKKNMPVERFVF